MINSIKGFKLKPTMTNEDRPLHMDDSVDWLEFDKMRNDFPICVDHEEDMISFKMLTKPASEGGNLNLCQLTDLIEVALHQLRYLNGKFPSRENAISITKFEEGLMWQRERTRNRVARGVEGKNES